VCASLRNQCMCSVCAVGWDLSASFASYGFDVVALQRVAIWPAHTPFSNLQVLAAESCPHCSPTILSLQCVFESSIGTGFVQSVGPVPISSFPFSVRWSVQILFDRGNSSNVLYYNRPLRASPPPQIYMHLYVGWERERERLERERTRECVLESVGLCVCVCVCRVIDYISGGPQRERRPPRIAPKPPAP
jgi:hypothetical protein